jgi:uncharacterized membrane protein YoaK (UPF0700 family)
MITVLQTILIGIIAFLGIPIGKFIARKTKEELKGGRKYFVIFSGLCLLALITDLILLAFKTVSIDECIMIFGIFTFMFLLTMQAIREGDKLQNKK